MRKKVIIKCLDAISKSQKNEDELYNVMSDRYEDFQGISKKHINDVQHNTELIQLMFDEGIQAFIKEYIDWYVHERDIDDVTVSLNGDEIDISSNEKFTNFLIKVSNERV